jgi:hypothetical protein
MIGSLVNYKKIVVTLDPEITPEQWKATIAKISKADNVIGVGYLFGNEEKVMITDKTGTVVALQG